MTLKTFSPKGDASVPLAAGPASASASLDGFSNAVRVYSAGPSLAFLRFTRGASTALVTDMPFAPGNTETFTIGDADTVSVITAAGGSAQLYCTNGEGL